MEHLVLDYIWITLRGLTKHRIQPTNISPCVYTPWPPPNLPGCTHGPRTHLCDYIHVTCYRCRFKKKKKKTTGTLLRYWTSGASSSPAQLTTPTQGCVTGSAMCLFSRSLNLIIACLEASAHLPMIRLDIGASPSSTGFPASPGHWNHFPTS